MEKTIPLYPATPLDDYQIMVKLTPSNIDYGAARPDGADIRFFDINGNTLDYWIEKWTRFATSIIWVKVAKAGTDKIVIKYGNTNAVSQSNGKAVFDPVSWETFKKNWQYSGIIPGRVAGWEDALTEFEFDTEDWSDVDIDTDYIPSCEDARWFVRREFFISGGDIAFSSEIDDDGVWSLIRSDEMYERIGGDEMDADGEKPHTLSASPFVIENDFDRYIWAGRGQDGRGGAYLKILSVDSGLPCIYTRKYFSSKKAIDKMVEQYHIMSLFPGDAETLSVGKISQGWKGWSGIDNFRIIKEGEQFALQAYKGDQMQKIGIPTVPFGDDFSLSIRFRFTMEEESATVIKVVIGNLDFGIGYSKQYNYFPYIEKKRGDGITIDKGKAVNFVVEKMGKKMLCTINGETELALENVKASEFRNSTFLELVFTNPTIYDIDLRMPDIQGPVSDHTLLFSENFSKMREGAAFSGWQGIENFKAMRDLGEIALVPYDEKEQTLIISNVPVPDSFSLSLEIALTITEKVDVALKVILENIEFGLGSEGAGQYSAFIGDTRKATDLINPGKRFRLLFEKRGKSLSLSINEQPVIEDMMVKDFKKATSITIKTLNPAIYSIQVRKL